jgi:alkanesulfonate monooxygenase SsuD/methylene tetrahydromethanopterin reductase-like flavin-dependent oxidoreductase (luciferase family)
MKFLAITLIVHNDERSPTERFREVVGNAVLAEELGFDGFGVGERHERPFISSSPPVVLSHVAAKTSRIRLFTAVTTLSLLDPVRAYEDYATLDHLSGGRLELIIGKGNGAAQAQLFHVTAEDQWDQPVFPTLEDAIERSSILVGSPQQVIDKVLRYHKRFGHEVMHLHADADGLTPAQHRDALELFQAEIAPVLRREIPSRPFAGGVA